MALTGRVCLALALALCVAGAGASLYGARRVEPAWADRGRRAVYALAAILTIAFAILEVAFLRSDFSFATVQAHSSTATPGFYKATAMWSSQEGSLLLWVWLLSLWSALVLRLTGALARDLVGYAPAAILGFGAFFTMLSVFFVHPFARLPGAPIEGAGLTPLLRHPMMM